MNRNEVKHQESFGKENYYFQLAMLFFAPGILLALAGVFSFNMLLCFLSLFFCGLPGLYFLWKSYTISKKSGSLSH